VTVQSKHWDVWMTDTRIYTTKEEASSATV